MIQAGCGALRRFGTASTIVQQIIPAAGGFREALASNIASARSVHLPIAGNYLATENV
jgi:hypothetical protein